MVTEVLNISIIETGSRVVKRNIDDIGRAADNLTRGIYLLRRAFFTLGAGGLVSVMTGLLDTLVNYQNRLMLTSTSVANMTGVQEKLFDVARRSRTEFESVAEIYSRTALSAKNLGLSQQEVLDITETLSKAAIISGANSREANAALVQLSQGLASNRLGGDELRSVLEQLPYVADIIADYLTKTGKFGVVGRGELRKLGSEGKLTADIIAAAFAASKGTVDAAFAKTNITIEQSISNVRTEFLRLLNEFNNSTGLSTGIATAINALADNLGNLARAISAAALALGVFYAAQKIQELVSFIQYIRAYSAAMAMNAEMDLGAALAKEVLADAQARQMAQALIQQRQTVAYFATQVAELELMKKQTEFVVVNGRARSVLTGRFVNQAVAEENLIRITTALTEAEMRLTAEQTYLTMATSAATRAQVAAAAAGAEATAAQTAATAASSGMWARLAARFPVITYALNVVSNAWRGFIGLIAKNPLTALILAIGAAIIGITTFGDKIHIAAGSIVTLQDIVYAAFSYIMDVMQPVIDYIAPAFQATFDFVGRLYDTFVTGFTVGIMTIILGFETMINTVIGIFAGGYAAISAAWTNLPGVLEGIAITAANLFLGVIEWMVNQAVDLMNTFIKGFNAAAGLMGATPMALFDPVSLKIAYTPAAKAAGTAVADAFTDGFMAHTRDSQKAVGAVINGIMDRATERAQNRAADNALIAKAQALNPGGTPTTPPGTPGGGGGSGGAAKDLAKYLQEMEKQIYLNSLIGNQAAAQTEIDKIESALKRQLTSDEKALVEQMSNRVEVSKEMHDILETLNGPMEKMQNRLAAINQLFADGRVSLAQYNDELRHLAVMATSGQNSFLGGISNGLAKVSEQATNFGENISQWVVGTFDAAADAVVNFAKTGEFNFRQFMQDIFAQLLKIMTNQLLSNFIGSLFGISMGAGGLGSLNLPKFAGGGEFMVGGAGGTDSQLVMFKASPDERVSIKTPEQQRAHDMAINGAGAGGNVTVNPAPVNVKIVNHDDPQNMVDAMSSDAGAKAIMNVIRKNPATIKRMLS